ncbi:MAG: response regulator [Desulfuromonadales bacterium]|nr:response regulator [Desulfuromonadales bacterium]
MEQNLSHTPLSLLFIEDDSVVCKAMGRMIALTFTDMTVYTADNGQSGMELFTKHTPGIVITDINMPDMDGHQVAREIKSKQPGTKIIVITGYSDEMHLDEFKKIGFDEYLVKPVDFARLCKSIERCRAGFLPQKE